MSVYGRATGSFAMCIMCVGLWCLWGLSEDSSEEDVDDLYDNLHAAVVVQ